MRKVWSETLPKKRRIKYKRITAAILFFVSMFIFVSCADGNLAAESENFSSGVLWSEMTVSGRMELSYAQEFSVDYYDGGYRLIEISDGSRFLAVPEGADIPQGIDADIIVLRIPVKNVYLAASAAMDHFCSLDALDAIRLSAMKTDGWYIEKARQAMEQGRIAYAGKYSAPDYELILESGCELAIESTMILHSPEVKEQMEKTGISVLIDRSSYEQHPLGRSEWIKLYGVLTCREERAEAVFREQEDKLNEVLSSTKSDRGEQENALTQESGAAQEMSGDGEANSVAFFYITSSGGVNIRKSGDYVSRMIELAGGRYVFDDIGDGKTATATATIQMEDFYAGARDADYLIYNSTIDGNVETLEQLLQKSTLLTDFKAVQLGNVYVIGKNMYQETSEAGTIILDMYKMFQGEDENMKFLRRLK